MKYIIIAVVAGFFLLVVSAQAASIIVKGVEFARVGAGSEAIVVSRVVDGDVTCYVTKQGKFGAHAISCVK